MKNDYKDTEIGKLPEDWELTSVAEVAQINESSIGRKYPHNEIEYIDIDSVEGGSIKNIQKLKLSEAPSRAKRIVKDNDILVSTVRPNLRHFALVLSAKSNTIASTGFAVISAKNIDSKFLYYYLTTERYTNYLSAIADAHTSTYPSFNPDIIENSKIPYPPLPEQRAIAKILSDLDAKIELNRQMNKTLEQIGQALFKRWFVDFEFPNEEGKPYKSSGGEMVDSELGEIPEEFEISSIGKEFKTILGGTPSTQNESYWKNGTVAWINSGKTNEFRVIEPTTYITEEAVNNSATKLMPKGTTILAITGATLGQVSRIEIDTCGNQSVIGIIENEKIHSVFIYFWIKHKIKELVSHQTGGAQQHINKNNVDELGIIISNRILMLKFKDLLEPIFDSISTNCFESKNLSQVRDSLLPKLMSGTIRCSLGS